MKRLSFVALLPVAGLAALLGLSGCGRSADPWEGESGSPRVVVTIAPLYSFVKAVTGKDGAVKCICTKTGPHQYKIDTRDARLLQKADVMFGIGLQLDDQFSDSMITLAQKKDLPLVKLGDKLPEKLKLEFKDEEDKEGDKHGDHDHGKYDPHVWLGIPQAIAMIGMIRDQLSEIDEGRKADYKKNADAYIKVLEKLKSEAPKDVRGMRIISFHDSLQYFSKSFGVEIADVIELGPGDESSSPHLAKLRKLCKEKGIRVIAVEPQYPTTTSATILRDSLKADNIKIELVPVDPMETGDAAEMKKEGAEWYTTRMRQNLKDLASALK